MLTAVTVPRALRWPDWQSGNACGTSTIGLVVESNQGGRPAPLSLPQSRGGAPVNYRFWVYWVRQGTGRPARDRILTLYLHYSTFDRISAKNLSRSDSTGVITSSVFPENGNPPRSCRAAPRRPGAAARRPRR